VRQRLRQVVAAVAEELAIAAHQLLTERRQRHRNLDRGAGLKSAAERQLLVDDGQDAARVGICHHHRSVV
jgi:hypothetical protein